MKRVLFGITLFASVAASAAVATLNGDGRISIPELGIDMGVRIHAEGWKGHFQGIAWAKQRFPDAKTGIARWRAVNVRKDGMRIAHGTVSLTAGSNGVAQVKAVAVSDVDQKPECVTWSLELSAERFGGGTWCDDAAKKGIIPAHFDGKRVSIYSRSCKSFSLTDKAGASLAFSFAEPVSILLQDGRRWGASTFTLRLFKNRVPFDKGTKRALAFSFTAGDGVTVKYAAPTIVQAGPDWIPVDYRKNILAGSALDFSNQGLQDAPAGKYGWLRNVGGRFEFEKRPGVPQRFYGVNLCFSANYPDHTVADEFVTRLVRLGYNTVRAHHIERDLFVDSHKGGLVVNEAAFEKFDYLMAKLFAAGIYVTTDMFTTRNVRWADIGYPEREGTIKERNVYKCLVAVHHPAFEDWCRFTKLFLEHVNPYTGRRYLDEPALPLLSLVNEGQLTMGWGRGAREELAIQAAYAKWLAERRAQDPAFCPTAPELASKLNFYGANGNVMALFMADIERRSARRMIDFLRKLGAKALLTNANNGPHPVVMQNVRADLYDYVDDHFYIDHPHFLEKRWALPSKIGNLNPVLDPKLALINPAFVRLADKPFCITEWNFSGPGMFRGVGGIMTGALSALQDWDGLWRFAYSHSLNGLKEGPCRPGYFDVGTDPLGQSSDRASVCLFLRRDLASLTGGTAFRVTPESISGSTNATRAVVVRPKWSDAVWHHRVATAGTSTKVPADMKELPLTEALIQAETPPFACATSSEFALLRDTGAFRINTPRTAGGFTPAGSLDCGAISFTVEEAPATVWASSVDAEPTDLRHAKRILVTHLTDVQADGNVYADTAKTVLLKWGKAQPIARKGRAEVRLAHKAPEKLEVWSLETTGARRARVPSRVVDGRLVFTVEIAAPSACLNYEIAQR